jgi:hypothetical protein
VSVKQALSPGGRHEGNSRIRRGSASSRAGRSLAPRSPAGGPRRDRCAASDFDEKTGRIAANHLNYAPDKYDFTEYFEDRTFDGIRLAARRLGYNADAQGKAGPKLSETLYEEIRWKVSLPESLSAPPAP